MKLVATNIGKWHAKKFPETFPLELCIKYGRLSLNTYLLPQRPHQHHPLMKKAPTAVICALIGTFTLSGCISSTKTEYVDEERVSVAFESSKAESDFSTGLERRKSAPVRFDRPEERTSVWLVVVNVSRRKITSGPNRDFNQNVRVCDTDKNNIISEREAESFLANSPLPPTRPAPAPGANLPVKAN
jgi:hypothetical protein